jgi:hypothetical protein
MGKSVDGRRGLDVGGTVDFTWGSDAYMVQSAGMENMAHMEKYGWSAGSGRWGQGDYYAAFAQAYSEVEFGRWNVKAGKFYAPFGSSAYKSTDNFFYTWASTAQISPHTGTGAYATYSLNSKWDFYGGWVMPDIELLGYGLGRVDGTRCDLVIGGLNWTPGKKLNVRYTFAAGETDEKGTNDYTDLFVHTFLVDYKISKRLKNVFEWTLVNITNVNTGVKTAQAGIYGINNELIYQANSRWAFGLRAGMLTWDAGDSDADIYTVGLGANWTPNKWLTVKPEIRHDWTNGIATGNTFGGSASYQPVAHQFSGGMSAIVKF